MSKSVKITAGIIMTMIFTASLVLFLISQINNKRDDINDAPKTQNVSVETAKEVEDEIPAFDVETHQADSGEYYVIRDIDGYLGIFSGSPEPDTITAVRTDSLRKADMERVKTGITVKGYENLLRLLEDFSS